MNHRSIVRSLSTLVACASLAIASIAQSTIYVDQKSTAGANNGTSWCDAYLKFESALAAAAAGDTVLIAVGVYTPPANAGRTSTFIIPPSITIIGGYAGCPNGSVDSDRTVLSGDLLRNDNGSDASLADNAYHVITTSNANAATTICSVHVTAGFANGSTPLGHDLGAGMLNNGGSPTLLNCVFIGNRAVRGGGAYLEGGTLNFTNCRFLGNHSTQIGSGVYAASVVQMFANCEFSGNAAGDDGGALFLDLTTTELLNCTLSKNSTKNRGGGVYCYVGNTVDIRNSIFWGNTSIHTGQLAQLYVNPSNNATVNYTIIEGLLDDQAGTANSAANPLFINAVGNDGIIGTLDDNTRLPWFSPGVNTGNNAYLPVWLTFDLDLGPRITFQVVDRGPYEL